MADPAAPAPTLAEIQALAVRNGWYEGVPVPLSDLAVTLCDTHPLKYPLEALCEQRAMAYTCSTENVNEQSTIRNQWEHPQIRGCQVYLVQIGDRLAAHRTAANPVGTMLLNTVGAARAWDLEAEERALTKLEGLVAAHTFTTYRLVDMFLETSPRSGLTYLFRKLRPTVVLTPHKGETMQILTTLCMHPLGYYRGSWAGCMVPTDDVLAHLLLMRGDEHEYWKRAEQHPAHTPEAGIF